MKKQALKIAVVLLGLLLASPLYARGLSLDQAVQQAKERMGGRVISAETQMRDGRRTHNIRILTDEGKLRRLRIDAGNNDRGKGYRR